jgi:hypothetical protein
MLCQGAMALFGSGAFARSLCLLRDSGRFLSNGSGIGGARIATRAFASFRANPASNSIITLVRRPPRETGPAAR